MIPCSSWFHVVMVALVITTISGALVSLWVARSIHRALFMVFNIPYVLDVLKEIEEERKYQDGNIKLDRESPLS